MNFEGTFGKNLFPCFNRRRTYVCSHWDYKYLGTNKGTYSQPWQSKYICFVPFLCSITKDVLKVLKEICTLESSCLLLFQKSVD